MPVPFCPNCNQPAHSATDGNKKVYACLHCGKVIEESPFPRDKKSGGEQLPIKSDLSVLRDTEQARTAYTGLVVELPLPPTGCSPNFVGHFAVRSRARKSYRDTCTILIKQALGERLEEDGFLYRDGIILHYDFYMGRSKFPKDGLYRARDWDNALGSMKSCQDAIRDIGLVPDDSKKWITIGRVELFSTKEEHKGRCGVVLTILPKGWKYE